MELEDCSTPADHDDIYFRTVTDLPPFDVGVAVITSHHDDDVCAAVSETVTLQTSADDASFVPATPLNEVVGNFAARNSSDGAANASASAATGYSADAVQQRNVGNEPEITPRSAEQQVFGSVVSNRLLHPVSPSAAISAKFEAMERAFRHEFLSSTADSSNQQNKEDRLRTMPTLEASQSSPSMTVPDDGLHRVADALQWTSSTAEPSAGMRQLVCLLTVLEQLAAMRSCNRRLQRKCDLLADGQALLRAQNQMLTVAASRREATRTAMATPSSAAATSPTSQRSSTARLDGASGDMRRSRTLHPQRPGVTSAPQPPMTAPVPNRLLSYQGTGSSTTMPIDRQDFHLGRTGARDRDSRATSGFKLQRSLSVGSMNAENDDDGGNELIDAELISSVTGYRRTTADQSSNMTVSASSAGTGIRREHKRSRKLQEKWEQVKSRC